MQRHVRTVVVIGLTVALIAFFLRNADLRGVWGAIADARLDFLSGALLLTVATYVVRVMRWRYLLRPVGRVGFNAAFRAVVMGFAATSVLPGRVGELLRPYVLARTARLSASATFGTVVVERLLDLIAVLLLFGISVVMFESGRQALDSRLLDAVQVGAGVAGTGALVMLVVAYLAAGHPGRVGRVIARTAGLLPSHMAQALSASARRFTTGLAITRQASTLLVAMAWSVFLWGCIAASLWLVTTAFAIALPLSGAATLLVLTVLGVAVPTPAGIGGYHAAYQVGATALYGVATDRAVGAALVLHAISFAPVTIVGIFFMAQEGVRLRGVGRLVLADARTAESAEHDVTDHSRVEQNAPGSRVVAAAADEEGGAG